MVQEKLVIKGARQHNLKNIDVEIPRNKLIVITGISGSGKSSLAFDTIYAEGQRRYVESLSAYARQFLGQMDKPDVDYIEGLSPAISIDQKGVSRNPRSTVGTVTEIYDYLRLLFARVGVPHCPQCGREISQQSVEQIVDTIRAWPDGTRILILAPLIKDRKGEHKKVIEDIRKAGFVRVRVDGETYDIDDPITTLDRYKMHSIEAVVDRLVVRYPSSHEEEPESGNDVDDRARFADSVETALKLGGGVVVVHNASAEPPSDTVFSERLACVYCGISLPEIEPRTFSFNSPHGACPVCTGLGTQREFDPDLIIPDRDLSLDDGALRPFYREGGGGQHYLNQLIKATADYYNVPTNVPVAELTPEQLDVVLNGSHQGDVITVHYENQYGRQRSYDTTFEGTVPLLQRRYRESTSDYARAELERYMTETPCPTCQGRRLKPEALSVTVDEMNIVQVSGMSITRALKWIERLQGADTPMKERQRTIARQVLKELVARLRFLVDVGLDYLTIDRTAGTLSGGEAQRIRLATQIGSHLVGVLYILDEPSIGLHQRDNARLIRTLERLRDMGNTVMVVEHDAETMRAADWILDLGPGAGEHGGYVVCAGTVADIEACTESLTGQFLTGRRQIPLPTKRRTGNGHHLTIVGAEENNLKRVSVEIPLGKFVCITGVSGSGKSSLIIEILYNRLAQVLNRARTKAGKHEDVTGIELLDKVIDVDQSPIGRTPRSNPATYTNLFTDIRTLFATVPEAKIRGYQAGRFSFNVKGGRCEACHGDGIIRIEMQFLPDVYVPCEVCHGQRYNREALEIRYKGRNIADVLNMTVDEASEFFGNVPRIQHKLETLQDVGLGYIRLGQPATTLSGGEAQRIKLAKELSRRSTGRTMYILDEPTTGLHFADIDRLLQVLNRLVDSGNTVVVIEHNLDVIKTADWIIDLGPEGGEAGGEIIARGTPEQVAGIPTSFTGQFLRPLFEEAASRRLSGIHLAPEAEPSAEAEASS
jgi:excinuclease ABC subunit A